MHNERAVEVEVDEVSKIRIPSKKPERTDRISNYYAFLPPFVCTQYPTLPTAPLSRSFGLWLFRSIYLRIGILDTDSRCIKWLFLAGRMPPEQ